MSTSGNQGSRQRNLPILGKDRSQRCSSCATAQGCAALPTHVAIPHTHRFELSWDLNRIKTGQGPFLWHVWKTHDEAFSGFWKQQGLVIYSWSKIWNRRIFGMEGIHCVPLSVTGGVDGWGQGIRQWARRGLPWLLGSDPNLPWEIVTFRCLRFPVPNVPVFLKEAWE